MTHIKTRLNPVYPRASACMAYLSETHSSSSRGMSAPRSRPPRSTTPAARPPREEEGALARSSRRSTDARTTSPSTSAMRRRRLATASPDAVSAATKGPCSVVRSTPTGAARGVRLPARTPCRLRRFSEGESCTGSLLAAPNHTSGAVSPLAGQQSAATARTFRVVGGVLRGAAQSATAARRRQHGERSRCCHRRHYTVTPKCDHHTPYTLYTNK